MKAMSFIHGVVLALGLMPWLVQASDADTFVAASRNQQAQLLEQWTASPEPQRLPLLAALSKESVLLDSKKTGFHAKRDTVDDAGRSRYANRHT